MASAWVTLDMLSLFGMFWYALRARSSDPHKQAAIESEKHDASLIQIESVNSERRQGQTAGCHTAHPTLPQKI